MNCRRIFIIAAAAAALAMTTGITGTYAKEKANIPDLLMTGTFSYFDIEASSGEMWYGVYKKKDGYHLVKTKIKVEKTAGEVESLNDAKVMVSAEGEGQPLFLVKGIDGLKEGPLTTCFAGQSVMGIGRTENIKCGKKGEYTLSAAGVAGKDGKTYSYGITLRHGKEEQDLDAEDTCAGAGATLYWAGDIDGDGALDLLIDMSCDGSTHDYTLLLSSYAMGEGLVDDAAEFDTMNE